MTAQFHFVASEPHFVDHLAPVWHALPPETRGGFWCGSGTDEAVLAVTRARHHKVREAKAAWVPHGMLGMGVVAAVGDLVRARRTAPRLRFMFMEHGCGLTYKGASASYIGSAKRPNVDLIITPNPQTAALQRQATPHIDVQSAGSSARLDQWAPGWQANWTAPDPPVVAISWHFDYRGIPETRSALKHYRRNLDLLLAGPWKVIGHGHPRIWPTCRVVYEHWGIEPVRTFDEVLQRASCYVVDNSCVVPDTPVLMADMHWKRAGDVLAGEKVIGCDEERFRPQLHPNDQTYPREDRRYRVATVIANETRRMPCYRVTTDKGTVTVSSTHPWLYREKVLWPYVLPSGRGQTNSRKRWSWVGTESLSVGDEVAFLAQPWERIESHDAGWLGGIFDGEGCLNVSNGRPMLSVAQNRGPVLDRIRDLLADMGVSWTDQVTSNTAHKNVSCHKLTISGRLADRMRLLGQLRPERLIANAIDNGAWDGPTVAANVSKARIESIDFMGEMDVSVMQTDTSTFIANGFIAHNSTLYEFAATGRPVVAMNCPDYRRNVNHGLRFWEHIPGIQVDGPTDLPKAVATAVEDPPELQRMRQRAVDHVYPQHDGHAADRIAGHMLRHLATVPAAPVTRPPARWVVLNPNGAPAAAYGTEYEAKEHARRVGAIVQAPALTG